MSNNSFKIKNSAVLTPKDLTTLTSPEAGEIACDINDSNKLKQYDAATSFWKEIGSGSGSVINYIDNPDFESGVQGYARYANAVAAAIPETGTGGSPNAAFTFTATTSSPLRGLKSGLLSKDANNRQGHGVSYDFTIDPADQAQVMTLSFDYVTSSAYVDGDIRVYVYDVTNSVLIEVVDRDLYGSNFGKFTGTFQTSSNSTSNSTSYRLIFHVASTNASAYTFELDNVSVGPQIIVKGPIVTDFESYTPTFGAGFGTVTNSSGRYKRVGDHVEIIVSCTTGTVAASLATISLPSGLSIDASKLNINNTTANPGSLVGQYNTSQPTAGMIGNIVTAPATSTSLIYIADRDGNAGAHLTPVNGSTTLSSSAVFSATVRVPILGWSSNVVLSDDAGNRDISFAVTKSASQTGINTNNTRVLVTWNTIESDSSASFNTTTSQFTAPESGKYFFSANITIAATNVLAANYALVFFKNNVQITGYGIETPTAATAVGKDTSVILDLSKGDTIDVRLYGAGNNSVNTLTINPGSESRFSGYKLPSPQTVAASEIVACRYNTNTARAVSDTTAIIFEDLVYDTHNAYNTSTGVFTCPQTGYYRFDSNIETNSFTPSAFNNYLRINVRNNTTTINTMGPYQVAKITGSAIYTTASISVILYVTKGDLIEFRYSETIPAVNLSTDNTANWMSITKVNGVS